MILKEKILKMVKSKWKFKNDDEIQRCVDCIEDIVTDAEKFKDLSNILFSCSLQDCSFDTVIYNTLIRFNKNRSIAEKIEMTVNWNRFDIAQKELFNDKIDWVTFFNFCIL